MAKITDYDSLQSNILDWLNRDDTDLTAAVPTMIQLAEAKFQRRWRDVTALSDTNTTNWLLTSHPDVYLYGSLLEAEPYLKDDERAALWGTLYEQAASQVRVPDTDTDLSTYIGLKMAVSDWLDRPDLDNAIPHFITMAEARLKRDPRVRDQTCRGTWTITADGDALPSDFGRLDAWYHDGTTYYGPIEIVSDLGKMKALHGLTATGVPRYAAIKGDRLFYAPAPDTTYETKMSYWRKLTALSGSNTTNWLLTGYPDVYLYAALAESVPYLTDETRGELWEGKLEAALSMMRRESWEQLYGGGTVRRQHRAIGG